MQIFKCESLTIKTASLLSFFGKERKFTVWADMAPLVSFLVFLDTLSFQLESLFKFLVRNIDKLLTVRRLAIEFAKARGQINVIALVRIGQLFIRLEAHIV